MSRRNGLQPAPRTATRPPGRLLASLTGSFSRTCSSTGRATRSSWRRWRRAWRRTGWCGARSATTTRTRRAGRWSPGATAGKGSGGAGAGGCSEGQRAWLLRAVLSASCAGASGYEFLRACRSSGVRLRADTRAPRHTRWGAARPRRASSCLRSTARRCPDRAGDVLLLAPACVLSSQCQVRDIEFERDLFVENDGLDDERRIVHFWELRFASAAAGGGGGGQ